MASTPNAMRRDARLRVVEPGDGRSHSASVAAEIHGLTLLNSYTARLVRQNEVNVREAWLRTELFSQKLALSAGRLDLTNYFDRNVVANDETTQFVSDALVNNPVLVLPTNGTGVVGLFDPKNGWTFKAGFQQTNSDATNLTESIYTLSEVGYVARPPGLEDRVVLDLLDRNISADRMAEPTGDSAPIDRNIAAHHAQLGPLRRLAIHRKTRAVRPPVAQFAHHRVGHPAEIALQCVVFQKKPDNSAHLFLLFDRSNVGDGDESVNRE